MSTSFVTAFQSVSSLVSSLRSAAARRPKTSLACALVMGLCFSGCGGGDGIERVKVHPVKGAIVLDGKPLPNAQVAFHPKNATDKRVKVALGTTDSEGKFQLTTYDSNDGAAAGEFVVTVQQFQLVQEGTSFSPGPNVLAPKIAVPESSDIVLKVAEGPNDLQPIEVRR